MRGTSQGAQVCRLRGQSLKRALQVNASVSLRQSVQGDPLADPEFNTLTALQHPKGGEFETMNTGKTAANGANREGASRNLASISPFFIVRDLQTSISYYRERLGFQLDFQGPEDDPY